MSQLDVTNTDYMGGFQYVAGKLSFFPHAEGYVNATENVIIGGGTSYTFNYVFNFTDHLGNIRLSYSKDPTTSVLRIIEENHYYPFGLKHSGYNSDRMMYSKEGSTLRIRPVPPLFQTSYDKKFNGKSWETELGLNVTAMDFRMYDNALGRFHNIDKMTDIMPSLSPYRFAFNNPVLWGDPTGLLESGGGEKAVNDKNPIKLDEVEIVATRKSSVQRPASFNYSLVSLSDWRSPNRPTLEQYNKHHGTNYQSVNDWYYHEKYVPAQNKMTTERNQAGRTVIGTLTVLATAGVGTAYALPVAAACSPAIQSTVATLATNPTIQQSVFNITLNAGSQFIANGGVAGDINMIEAGLSGVPGTNLIPTIAGETFSYSANDGFQTPKSFSKWAAQVGGGVLSNRFGKATDSFLGSEGVQGKVAGEYFKFIIETGSNAAPNLIEE